MAALRQHFASSFPGVPVSSSEAAVSGKNWGEVAVQHSALLFSVGGQPAFRVDCSDISNVSQQGKTDVLLELASEEAADKTDTLFELSFHVPQSSKKHAPPPGPGDGGDPDAPPPVPAKVLADALTAWADVGPATGEPVASFQEVAVIIPRGRFDIKLFPAYLRLENASSGDFKIPFANCLRLFILPRPNSASTLVVLSLDPPIRRGATHYPHLVLSFRADDEVDIEPVGPGPGVLEASAGLGGDRPALEASYTGTEADVFAKIMKALSGVKTTRQGSFTSPSGGVAVRCVHKADDGHLYPLEKAFFFLPKPSIFIRHDDVSEIEFERNQGGSSKTFDLNIKVTEGANYRFSGIAKAEYDNLVAFLTAKRLPVASLAQPAARAGALPQLELSDSGGDSAGGLRGDADEDEEEDEDFNAAGVESDGGEPSSEDEESDEEEGGGAAAKPKKAAAPAKKRAAAADGDEPAGKKKRAKKDPAAPKGALSAFMMFSKEKRPQVISENPGIAFTDVAKKIGELWKAATSSDKAPFEALAKQDKERYAKEMTAYKAGARGGGGEEEEDGGAEDMDE